MGFQDCTIYRVKLQVQFIATGKKKKKTNLYGFYLHLNHEFQVVNLKAKELPVNSTSRIASQKDIAA